MLFCLPRINICVTILVNKWEENIMLYKYGQIECAGWFAGKQNVLTGTTYIKISSEWRRCDLPILLDDSIKWGWLC